jgi:peptidyl-prolyl cis-trans isomerase SurA
LKAIARATLASVLVLMLSGLALAQSTTPSTTPAKPPAKPAVKPASSGTGHGSDRLDGIAAVVNDDVVLESDVEEQLYLFLMRSQARPDSSVVDTLRTQILNQLIDEKLIVAEAKRQSVTVTDAEVSKQVDDAISDAKERLGGEQGFREQLQRENTTEQKLREKYRSEVQRQLLAQKVVQKQLPRRTVTAAEAESYFKVNKSKFPKMPGEVRLQVIQIPASPDSAAAAQAKAKIMEIRKRVTGGEKFAKVAADVSDDPNSARSGGDLGFLPKGTLDRPLDELAFSIKLNELSQPVRSAVGWHLMEVLERDTLKTRTGRDSLDKKGQPIPEAHVRHILVRIPMDEEDVQRAHDLADKVHAEAIKGGDFGKLVQRYSKYDGQQGPDGDLGFISLGTLQPSIRAGIEPVAVGQVTDVLENNVGFNIFKVNDRKPEREYTLDEIRDELPDVVAQMKQREKYDEWVKGLRSKAHIEIRQS